MHLDSSSGIKYIPWAVVQDCHGTVAFGVECFKNLEWDVNFVIVVLENWENWENTFLSVEKIIIPF